MNKLKKSRSGRDIMSAFFKSSRRAFSLPVLAVMLGLGIWLANPSATVHGQSECLLNCEQSYVACLRQQNPNFPGIECDSAYEDCVDQCLS